MIVFLLIVILAVLILKLIFNIQDNNSIINMQYNQTEAIIEELEKLNKANELKN